MKEIERDNGSETILDYSFVLGFRDHEETDTDNSSGFVFNNPILS